VQRWDLAAPSESGRDGPRVLFSTAEARAVVIDLAAGQELGDHRVRERAILQVLDGQVECGSDGAGAECGRGTLVMFAPGEDHYVRALGPARLLLVLAPWPGTGHYDPSERGDPHELPANATERPRGESAG
jgi:quercetin dioxygenase-like cupin family protein